MKHVGTDAVIQAIKGLREMIATESRIGIPSRKRKILRREGCDLIAALERLVIDLDPVKQPMEVLDPSDPHTVGEVIAGRLLAQPRVPLASIEKFYGSGVYAIYYIGSFRAYRLASGTGTPLYVGKADPKTPAARTPEAQGIRLFRRLQDHQKSTRSATNLDVDHFECRYLVVKSAWQVTAETYLIDRFKPIWNKEVKICYGFGKHGDSSKTRRNKRSPWDTLHPGRPSALTEDTTPNELSQEQIVELIFTHYQDNPPEPKADLG